MRSSGPPTVRSSAEGSVPIGLILGRRRLLARGLLHRVIYVLVEILTLQARQIRLRLLPVALESLADVSILPLVPLIAQFASFGLDSEYLPIGKTSIRRAQASEPADGRPALWHSPRHSFASMLPREHGWRRGG